MTLYRFDNQAIPEDFYWFNEPKSYFFEDGLNLLTKANTDFWQKTHYGFVRDDGHCLLTKITGDFVLKTKTEFNPKSQYDQCGLMIRFDSENWIKTSIEYENTENSRIGSVVTNFGYSDWATTDISSTCNSMFYRISKKAQDFLIEFSPDDQTWSQMRIAHLHNIKESDEQAIGIYACSPIGSNFQCKFLFIEISQNH